jgi:hypothetical protein
MGKRVLYLLAGLTYAMLVTGCGGSHVPQVPEFGAIKPNSIAVMPVMNETVDMKAPEVVRPVVYDKVIAWGYESPPIGMVDGILAAHNIHEAGEVNQFTTKELGEMFSVDAILYTTITDWSTKWLAVYASQTVGLRLELKSTEDNQVLWENQYTYTERAIAGNERQMVGLVVGAAVSPYRPLVRRVVNTMFRKLPYGGR